ncbi:hypothetical protein FB567DRAFT_515715 [Paraphoma chrysanthemicola]|uniref:F-box domain-containing protein n=1 Tax=Paraphoma chrysanthemicola TaxID=798071 RepID=A0A8K0W2X9_9PLEO|nr:hypothetical protein FB567DRAFT_515715 [Paraphoma chrysanthemicola]
MLEQYACNLNAMLSHPPWQRDLDWSLHSTIKWEKRIPFQAYVRRDPIAAPPLINGSQFPQFSALPAELQLRILSFCPANTLFQVMRVSSTLRFEASKLFWTNPEAFFLIKAHWILDGGYAGDTTIDLRFLYHVQKVEIAYCLGYDQAIGDDGQASTPQDQAATFWRTLVQRLPSAKQVVILQNWRIPWWWQEDGPVARPLRMLLQACPNDIEGAALVLEESTAADELTSVLPTQRYHRSLYQLRAGGGWVKSRKTCHTSTILIPPKQFNGVVGRYHKLAYDVKRGRYQKYADWPLMIEALDRHHFEKKRDMPFICPFPNCDTHIAKAGTWTVHAVERHCMEWSKDTLMNLLPDELRATFKKRNDTRSEEEKQLDMEYRKLFEDWNAQGKHKRKETQHAWMNQLKNDPAWDTGEEAGKSRLWTQYWQRMHPTDKYSY